VNGAEPNAALDVAAADGAVIRLRRHGNPRGNRVFVSHGNGFAVDGYIAFWSRLLDRFDVILFDMRNHGRNPTGDPAHHDYPHMAVDLDAVWCAVEGEFGAKPTAGLFHSMSAQSALLQAMLCGARFEALVLFDPPNVPPADGPARAAMLTYLHRLVEWASQRRSHFNDPAELAADYAGTRAGRDWVAGAHEAVARSVLRRVPEGWALACPREFEVSMYEQGITLGLWPQRNDVATPVLLVGADPERPRPSPTALANRALAQQGGFNYVAIPGAGHPLQLEQPEACAEVALAFLTSAGFA
jgi:pimeloyl-ACP methyl ester carboxylesterase